ncbi:T-cell immunomodulatory protein-like, partial [Tachysurus ichikawai]
LSGLCSNDCPDKVKPFGVNQPGPYVMYTSVDSNGYLKNASGESHLYSSIAVTPADSSAFSFKTSFC